MRLSVNGSRSLADDRVKILIIEEIEKYKVTALVVAGEPPGVCEVARRVAQEYVIPLTLHFLNFRRKRGAFEFRSKAVITDSDRCLFIHDGKSYGTANELKMAQKLNFPYTYHQLERSEFQNIVGFEASEEWGDSLDTEDDLDNLLIDMSKK